MWKIWYPIGILPREDCAKDETKHDREFDPVEISETRKSLVLKGAGQMGKTWPMKEFGTRCSEHCVYFNFDEEEELKSFP